MVISGKKNDGGVGHTSTEETCLFYNLFIMYAWLSGWLSGKALTFHQTGLGFQPTAARERH